MSTVPWLFYVLVSLTAGAAVVFIVYALGVWGTLAGQRRTLDAQVAVHLPLRDRNVQGSSVGAAIETRLRNSEFGRQLISQINQAEIGYGAGQAVLYTLLIAGLLGFVVALLTRNPISAVLIMIMGVAVPYYALGHQASKRLDRLLDQLPDALVTMSNALVAGASLQQAVEQCAAEMSPPVSTEMRRVVEEIKVGRTLDEALINLRARAPLVELDSVIASILIQRRSGGNLADLLTETSALLKEDVQLKREMRVQTAQAVLSARMIGSMPIIIFAFLYFTNPRFLQPMLNDPVGITLLTIGLVLEAIGFIVVQRLAVIQDI